MKIDPNRALLGLPQYGEVSEDAIRAAYWRMVRRRASNENVFALAELQVAKKKLLFKVGVRIPKHKKKDGLVLPDR